MHVVAHAVHDLSIAEIVPVMLCREKISLLSPHQVQGHRPQNVMFNTDRLMRSSLAPIDDFGILVAWT